VKPFLRGWIHAGMIPLLTAAFAVLIVLSPTPLTRVGSSVYAASAILLFAVSGMYHRGNWQPKLLAFWRRFDHANIYIFIAGTYTPFAFLYLHGAARWALFGIVWGCAVAGAVFKIVMPNAPRWVSTPLYSSQCPAREPRYSHRQGGTDGQGLLGNPSIALGSRHRCMSDQGVDDCRRSAWARVVAGIARPGDQGLGVVGGVVEAAIGRAEVRDRGLEKGLGSGDPTRVRGQLGEGEVARGNAAVVLEHARSRASQAIAGNPKQPVTDRVDVEQQPRSIERCAQQVRSIQCD
jgi:hypothetical protein